MLPAALVLAILVSTTAQAQDEQRAPNPRELESFAAFQAGQAPGPALSAPEFDITRQPGQRDWRVQAYVDDAAYRAAGALCRMTRKVYEYNPRMHKNQRWNASAQRHFAWIDRAGCRKPAHPVELKQRIPDADLVPLIEKQAVLLRNARLLLAGNTSCAPHRSLRFSLSAIDVSAPPNGKEQLHALVFASDRAAHAQVWIRKRGAELNAWNVACTESQGASR